MNYKHREAFQLELAAQLRKARQDAGITQAELAGALGLSRTTVVNIEKKTQNIGVYVLTAWSKACGLKETTILARACR